MQTFVDGAVNGAINGALMLGIFTGLLAVGHVVAPTLIGFSLTSALATLTLGTVATSLFGGIASVRKENKEKKKTNEDRHDKRAQYLEHGPTRALIREEYIGHTAPIPLLVDRSERASKGDQVSSWRERVGASRHADKASHAEAVEAERAEAAEHTASLA